MHIDLKLGLSCNNACIHCIMEPIRRNLLHEGKSVDSSQYTVETIIDSIVERGADSVTLTGGEPTLRRDFFHLLNKVSALGISVTVQTNGRILGSNKSAGLLQALPHRNILFVVALHANSSDLHDKITRVRGSFEETTCAICTLHKLGFRVCGKMVLSCYNVHTIKDTLKYMNSLSIDEAVVAFPHAEAFTPEALRRVVPRYAEVRQSLTEITLATPFQQHVFWETIPFCQLPSPDFYAHAVDLGFLREHLHGGSTHIEMSMLGQCIDWEESRKSIKGKGKRCCDCLLDRVCEGVWEEYLPLHGDADLEPITDMKQVHALLEKL